MAEININQIKYLDYNGLQALWTKISDTFLRDSEVVSALTDTASGIITDEGDLFVQSKTLNSAKEELWEKIEEIESAQGTNIDNDTIINVEGKLQTNLILQNDKDNHVLSLITDAENNGKGTVVSTWDYTDFYNEAVKDGILDSVSLVTIPGEENVTGDRPAGTYLKFIFNTSSGKNPIYVNVTELIDVYTGSTYINVTKSGETSSIEIKTTELVDYLRTEGALGIDSIISRIEAVEDKNSKLEGLINELKTAWDELDVVGLKEQIETNTSNITNIQEYLKTVPNTPITDQEINELE